MGHLWLGQFLYFCLKTKFRQTMRKLINPKYSHLSGLFDVLMNTDYFELEGILLYDVGRNVIKRFQWEGEDLVIKRFGHITFFNRLMYSTVRKSKAMRAYKNASRLRAMGISTPEEIAVIEIFSHGILTESYFVSAYTSNSSLSYLWEFTYEKKEWFPLLDSLVAWIAEIHDKGILHQDLNVGNILYQEQHDGSINFQLIDINRMQFRTNLSVEERLKELSRLSTNLDLHLYLLRKYAELMKYDGNQIETKGCFYKIMFEYRQTIKRKIKGYLSSSFKRYCNGEIPR